MGSGPLPNPSPEILGRFCSIWVAGEGLLFRGNKTLQPQQLTNINRVVERSRNQPGFDNDGKLKREKKEIDF